MNEQIRRLADKIWAEEYWNNPNTDKLLPARLNKFALLIVQECLLSLEPDLYSEEIDYEFEQRFYKRCRDKIVKHFGVEE